MFVMFVYKILILKGFICILTNYYFLVLNNTEFMIFSIWSLGRNPFIKVGFSSLGMNTIRGILLALNSWASSGSLSTLILKTSIFPAYSCAISARLGANLRQGGHQSAYKSIIAGLFPKYFHSLSEL